MPDLSDGLRPAKYWEDQANEARSRAAEMLSFSARDTLLDVGRLCDAMAKRAREREARDAA